MADYLYYSSVGGEEHASAGYSMEDLLSCNVCCEAYHEKHRQPVVLPRCGHSFCRPCIAFMVKKGCIVCPSCRMDQRVEGADSLPTEFSLLAISCAQQVTKQESCLNHGVKLSFWCKTCNVSACGECLFEDHPMTSHIIMKSTSYVTEMKESVTKITNKFMDALDGREKRFFEKIFISSKLINDALRTITVLRKDMEEARELMKGVKIVEGISSTQALSEAAKFLGLKWNLQDVNLHLGNAIPLKEEPNTDDNDDNDDNDDENEKVNEEESEETEVPQEAAAGEKAEEVLNNTEMPNGNEAESSEYAGNEKEKANYQNEKDIDEEENLTEEEKRKRKKIQKLKERLAVATAAAELAKLEAEEKIAKKEIAKLEAQEQNDKKRQGRSNYREEIRGRKGRREGRQ